MINLYYRKEERNEFEKRKNSNGIFGFLPVYLLGSAIQVNAAETDFATCVKQDECILESDVTIDSTIDLTNDLILDLKWLYNYF